MGLEAWALGFAAWAAGPTFALSVVVPGDSRQSLGKHGEDLACRELLRLGYAILDRRYRTRIGELDIVARDGETVVFVEVKARGSGRCGAAAEAVTPLKRRKLAQMAADYVARRRLERSPCRFDVVAVEVGHPAPRVTIFRSAFSVDG